MFVLFLVASIVIATAAVAPNLLTQGLREREEEMIWRGEQYARAVALYYRKFGRFPVTMEELVEPKTGVRFLRKEFTDPMNREDGKWRRIYIGPGGLLIGSVTRTTPVPVPGQQQPGKQPGQQPGKAPAKQEQPPTGLTPQTPADATVIGGNIIGVGSKVNRASVKVYKGRNNYAEWEFIWDPTADLIFQQLQRQQQPQTPQQPPGKQPGKQQIQIGPPQSQPQD